MPLSYNNLYIVCKMTVLYSYNGQISMNNFHLYVYKEGLPKFFHLIKRGSAGRIIYSKDIIIFRRMDSDYLILALKLTLYKP